MNLCELIQWCNGNQGFLDFILSILSIVISVVAIVVSVRATREPYKYRISVNIAYYKENETPKLDITISNFGLGMASVKSVDVVTLNNQVCASTSEKIHLRSCEEKKCSPNIFDCEGYIEENALDLNNKIKVKVYMMDGRKLTFRNGFSVG